MIGRTDTEHANEHHRAIANLWEKPPGYCQWDTHQLHGTPHKIHYPGSPRDLPQPWARRKHSHSHHPHPRDRSRVYQGLEMFDIRNHAAWLAILDENKVPAVLTLFLSGAALVGHFGSTANDSVSPDVDQVSGVWFQVMDLLVQLQWVGDLDFVHWTSCLVSHRSWI